MNKKFFVIVFLIIFSIFTVPLFAGVSVDLGVSALGNALYLASRPLGGLAALGITLFEDRAIVQVTGGFFSPPLGDDYNDPAGIISAGVLFSPMEYLYLGFRTGVITPSDTKNWNNYGAMVFRVQKPGKGLHYFAESEISFSGIFNRFSMGLNLTL